MKDEFGHGSNGSNGGLKQHFAARAQQFGQFQDRRGSGEYPARGSSSDAAAAQALLAGVKSGVVPVHESMAGRASSPTTSPSPQNRRAGDGVVKGERTFGQEVNKHVVSQLRFGLRNT